MNYRIIIITIFLFLFQVVLPDLEARVIINEFLASNTTVNPDMVDFDDYSDWIELYNPHEDTVDLNGYFLTDNLNDPLKWAFPTGTILLPGEYLLIWADGYNEFPGNVRQRAAWPWRQFTVSKLHTNFKISALGEELGIFSTSESQDSVLIGEGSTWKYLDTGGSPVVDWTNNEYDDSHWLSGAAQLGYGDGDEVTEIQYGPDQEDKFTTTYFRKSFQLTDNNQFDVLKIRLLRDDGAVLYLNGSELFRSNMPEGVIDYRTFAVETINGSEENEFHEWSISSDSLVNGTNIIAVEVHQDSRNSADLSFDLELTGIYYSQVTLIDSVAFNSQIADVSLGRNPDANYQWYYYGEPTPAIPNTSPPTRNTEICEEVSFSTNGGFFVNAVMLELGTNSGNGNIHFTTDGSFPKSSSQLYTSHIRVSETTVIRARIFDEDKLPGPVSTHSYFINEEETSLPVVAFTAEPRTLWDSDIGIYENNYKGKEIPVSLEYFDADKTLGFTIDAGARIGGLNIWRFAQKPLTINTRNRYGFDEIQYQLFPSKTIGIFQRIVFRNGGDSWHKDMLRDGMTESILKGQMDNGVQAYSPCVIFINGDYWGIHNNRERFDEQYFASNFNADPSNIDHLEYAYTRPNRIQVQTVSGSSEHYDSIIEFVNNNDITNDNNYDYIRSQMDIDSFIDFIIIEQFVCNTSWMHNREWWRPNTENAKWKWLIPDLDRGYNILNLENNILDDFDESYTLYRRLITNQRFKNRLVQRFNAHLNSTFLPDRLIGILDSLSENIAQEMPKHIERWSQEEGIQSMTDWENNLNDIKQFCRQRGAIMRQLLNDEFLLDGTAQLTINFDSPESGKIFVNDVPLLEDSLSGLYFKNIPLWLRAVPKVGYQFAGWEGYSDSSDMQITLDDDLTITARFLHSSERIIPGEIRENTILTSEFSPYSTLSNINIHPDVTLFIDQGVQLKMPQDGSIFVYGNLIITGSKEHPVIIEPNSDAGAANWGALCFVNSTDTSRISHTVIRGATMGDDPFTQKAAISGYYADLIMEDLLLEDVGFPIFTQFGSTILRNSSISTDVICDYINVKHGKALIENCTFFGNNSPDTDAIDYDGIIDGIIRNNRIYNFQGFNCDAIDIGEGSRDLLIQDNLIYNSTDKGISIGQKSTVIIERNLVVGCNQGVAVKDSSFAIINQNTFFDNDTAIACYVKNPGRGGGNAEVINTIISQSGESPVFIDSLSSIEISYSLSDTDSLPGENNLVDDPRFINQTIFNLQLRPESPCIDAGDPSYPQDEDGSNPDIGAYYIFNPYDYPFNNYFTLVINEINYNSSEEKNPGDWIELLNPHDRWIDLSGWILMTLDDEDVFTFPDQSLIEPEGYAVICRDTSAFLTSNPSLSNVINIIGNTEFGFNNDGDAVRLYDSERRGVDSLTYDDEPPWAIEPDGNGTTLELIDPTSDNESPESWSASLVLYGTPGKNNSVAIGQPDIPGGNSIPTRYALHQNFPNPFNSSTLIRFDLVESQWVKLTIYNILGKEVAHIKNLQMQAGFHTVVFDVADLASGIYIYKLEAEAFTSLRKMVLIK
ncbi:MAG: CotH kinase family protein [Candidatus Electryonea clarkiae]|nr:CotH kinase family protein [Candidatus Electryonea clarkiae]MDP8285942.1 CotH kinase family protein [Candidatus Electryonea clarkiae]